MTTVNTIPRTGGCDCGALRYEIAGPAALHVYACHCLSCQTRSSSAFAEHALLPEADLTVTGALTAWTRESDGLALEETFCAQCLTRIFNRNSALPGMAFLRAGTLDDSAGLVPMAHIWVDRKQGWLALPKDVPQFPRSPTPEDFAAAIRRAETSQTD